MPPATAPRTSTTASTFDGPGLTNLQYAFCAEEMGRILWSSEAFNCSAPDTGNMEVLHRYGTREQKEQWLKPLMDGEIRSAFLMTEPEVASSDATNIQCRIEMRGNEYVVNGRKWWSSGAGDPRCKLAILMGKSDPAAKTHQQQSMILVPLDADGVNDRPPPAGVRLRRRAARPHGSRAEGRPRAAVEHAARRGARVRDRAGAAGPGRIHHCMRIIGVAEEALEAMTRRLLSRTAFGKTLAEQSVWEERIADARIDIEMTRLLCLKAADMMDRVGNKAAQGEIAMIKVAAPRTALKVLDDAIQAHGGAGVSEDFGAGRRLGVGAHAAPRRRP